MSKQKLIADLAEDTGCTKNVVEKVVEALGARANKDLSTGQEVSLPGLGKLVVTTRAARTARNPRTGGAVEVPAKHVVRFKPTKTLVEALS